MNQRAGPRLCLPGPIQLHLDPTKHASIHVREAVLVNANEALVIYGNGERGDGVEEKLKPIGFERRVLYGPTRYVPKPDEWVHEFSWHGSDPNNKTAKVKDMLKFKLLRIIADQFYYNVREVRTKDDTTLTVKLMIFFELVDVVKMLDRTHDPIADFINAVASDTVQHCSGLTYEQFVENTSQMNDLATFGSLCSRAETIGYKNIIIIFISVLLITNMPGTRSARSSSVGSTPATLCRRCMTRLDRSLSSSSQSPQSSSPTSRCMTRRSKRERD